MRPASTRFLAILLLIGQLLIGVVPGRSSLVPLAACADHAGTEHGADHGRFDDCEPFACAGAVPVRSTHCHDHEDTALQSDVHLHDDCGCHVHVPLYGSNQLPALVQQAEQAHIEVPQLLCPGVLAVLEEGVGLPVRLRRALWPPDLSETEQARALRVTCLLI